MLYSLLVRAKPTDYIMADGHRGFAGVIRFGRPRPHRPRM